MALASFKDLVVDAVDAPRLGAFWSAVLGLEATTLDDGDLLLSGPTRQHAIWVNQVPEPVTVKQRVHLDVRARSVEDVLALGAVPEDLDSFDWKVLRDPEGGELCVFERAEVPDYRLYEVVVDARDPERIAQWWADVLGASAQHGEGYSWVEQIPGAPFEALVFVPVPEPKTVKNRIHWDVTVADLDRLVGDGATVLRPQDDEIRWTVMADPEGNEFCAFTEGS
jgi:predicted enzyme related to lactoylglutathione lyase